MLKHWLPASSIYYHYYKPSITTIPSCFGTSVYCRPKKHNKTRQTHSLVCRGTNFVRHHMFDEKLPKLEFNCLEVLLFVHPHNIWPSPLTYSTCPILLDYPLCISRTNHSNDTSNTGKPHDPPKKPLDFPRQVVSTGLPQLCENGFHLQFLISSQPDWHIKRVGLKPFQVVLKSNTWKAKDIKFCKKAKPQVFS